jgi:hypothetical protein
LRGFWHCPPDLRLQESSLHENDGHRWDPAGKRLYLAIVEIPDETAKERFPVALATLDEMLLGGGEL